MTYATQHILLSWLYKISGTDERGETSVRLGVPIGTPDAVDILSSFTTTNMDNFYLAMASLCAGLDIKYADYAVLDTMKAAAIGTNGLYLTDPLVTPTGAAAGNDTEVHPQSTVVLSLRSGSNFGDANFGRMYLPYTALQVAPTTPYATSARATAMAANFATFVNTVNGEADSILSTLQIMIMSAKGTGTNKSPTQVACGRVNDTQRRRRNRLNEDYSFASVP